MSERDEKRRGSGCAIGLLVVVLLLPVLYVLSLGPAAWLDSQYPPQTGIPVIRAVYAPLDYAGDMFEPFGAALRWYVSFWT